MSYSLLYPQGTPTTSPIDMKTFSALGGESLLPFFAVKNTDINAAASLVSYCTSDMQTLTYRVDILEDILENQPLFDGLSSLKSTLEDMELSVKRKSESGDAIEKLSFLREITNFFDFAVTVRDLLSSPSITLKSSGLKCLKEKLDALLADSDIKKLKDEFDKFLKIAKAPKSLTVGINLNAELKAVEAGLVSVNDDFYKSSNIIDRIMMLNFSKSQYSCVTEFIPLSYKPGIPEHDSLHSTLLNTFNKVYSSSLKIIDKFSKSYFELCAEMIPSSAELNFFLNAALLIKNLKSFGLPVCRANAGDSIELTGLYNVSFALLANTGSRAASIIENNFSLGNGKTTAVLTGPSGGGKTTFAEAIGLCQLMFQLGLYVPAEKADLPICRTIRAHYASKDSGKISGAFDNECSSVKKMIAELKNGGMMILNDAFSTASYADGEDTFEEVLKALAHFRVYTVAATHFCETALKINNGNFADALASAFTISEITDESARSYSFALSAGASSSTVSKDKKMRMEDLIK